MGNKDTSFQKTKPLHMGEKKFDFSKPVIMGILNLTPDSFYDGGKYNNEEQWILQTQKMVEEGAGIIDLGAVSTRPGAEIIPEEEELRRLIGPLKILKKEFPNTLFSIDTFRSQVAIQAVDAGAQMINDISGGNFDRQMFATVARLKVPYVLMHMHGMPRMMQDDPISTDIVKHVRHFFEEKVRQLNLLGFENIILDPGFGFGKTMACNYELLRHLEEIRINGLPVLTGISRKSMINKVLKINAGDALNGTSVLHTLALHNGANLLRVHDVKEAREVVKLMEFYNLPDSCE